MNKNVLLICPTLTLGGAERVISILANNFSKDGINVIILLMFKRPISYELSKKVRVVEPTFIRDDMNKLVYLCKLIPYLYFEIRKVKPSVILSFLSPYNLISILCSTKYPLFISDRSSPNIKKGTVKKILEKILYPKADGIIAQTEKSKKYLLDKGLNNNIRVIKNPTKIIKQNDKINKENIILNIGRLVWEKNQIELINIFKSLKQEDWKLVIIGKGPLEEKIINEINGHPRISLITDSVEVKDYYNKSKIFALTSVSEGYPNTLCEAMSAGLPCISYDCVAGPSEIISNESNGYLIDLNNSKLFIEKLSELIDNENLRKSIGSYAASHIRKFDEYTQSKKYLNFMYENIH